MLSKRFKAFENRVFCVWHRLCDCDFFEYLYACLSSPPPLSPRHSNSLPTDFYYHPFLLFNYLRFVTYVISFHRLRLLSAPLFCTYSLGVRIITWLCTPSRTYVCIWSTRTRVRIADVYPLFLSLSLWKSEEKQEEGEFDVIAREYSRPANAR